MTKLFAVRHRCSDGPDGMVLIEAETPQEAKEEVMNFYASIDMDNVSIDELVATDLGRTVDDVIVLDATEELGVDKIKWPK